MKNTLRTFVAVEIDQAIRTRAAELIRLLQSSAADVKWVETHNLHLTLQFLGDVNQQDLPAVCQAVERGAGAVETFELEVRGTGAFPNATRPRTIWLGAAQGTQPMAMLHDRVEAELAKLGYPKENRPFQTHLTIGRVRGGRLGIAELGRLIEQNSAFPAGQMAVRAVTVFSSTLTSEGPIYQPIGKANLRQ